MMADWIHCNSCYRQPGHSRKFSLTNCGHIYCEECATPGSKLRCKMCGNQCTTIALTANMKPDVEQFFTKPIDLLKKHAKQMQKVMQVIEFQHNHATRLSAYKTDTLAKQENAAFRAKKATEEVRELEREVMVLKDENSYLKKVLSSKGGQFGRSSPMTKLSPGASQPCSQKSSYSQSAGHSLSQHSYPTASGGNAYSSQHVKGPGRISLRTPPGSGRFGLPRTPSPQSNLTSTGSHGDAALPGHYDNRARMSGNSPMNVSPHLQGHRSMLSVPPVCMPITPNRPHTPNYTMDCSPADANVTYSQQYQSQRSQIQIKYPLKSGYKTS